MNKYTMDRLIGELSSKKLDKNLHLRVLLTGTADTDFINIDWEKKIITYVYDDDGYFYGKTPYPRTTLEKSFKDVVKILNNSVEKWNNKIK